MRTTSNVFRKVYNYTHFNENEEMIVAVNAIYAIG